MLKHILSSHWVLVTRGVSRSRVEDTTRYIYLYIFGVGASGGVRYQLSEDGFGSTPGYELSFNVMLRLLQMSVSGLLPRRMHAGLLEMATSTIEVAARRMPFPPD